MIEPTEYHRKLEGKSNSHLITFNDGRKYVVKFFQEGFERTLPNEWIAYCLARYLGLPVPFAQIVEIPYDFTSQIPDFAIMNPSKYQFASHYVPACFDGHEVASVSSILNHQSLAGIILFDYWLCNRDRTRKNILLCDEEPNTYKLWMIDQAEVFGSYNWSLRDLENLPMELMKSATHQLMAHFIRDEQDFVDHLERIHTTPILLMEEIVALIPDDWMVLHEERKAIVSTLLHRRRKLLPKMMERFIKRVYRPIHEFP